MLRQALPDFTAYPAAVRLVHDPVIARAEAEGAHRKQPAFRQLRAGAVRKLDLQVMIPPDRGAFREKPRRRMLEAPPNRKNTPAPVRPARGKKRCQPQQYRRRQKQPPAKPKWCNRPGGAAFPACPIFPVHGFPSVAGCSTPCFASGTDGPAGGASAEDFGAAVGGRGRGVTGGVTTPAGR